MSRVFGCHICGCLVPFLNNYRIKFTTDAECVYSVNLLKFRKCAFLIAFDNFFITKNSSQNKTWQRNPQSLAFLPFFVCCLQPFSLRPSSWLCKTVMTRAKATTRPCRSRLGCSLLVTLGFVVLIALTMDLCSKRESGIEQKGESRG